MSIDVLAVMDDDAMEAGYSRGAVGGSGIAKKAKEESRQARAAVAELIAAVGLVLAHRAGDLPTGGWLRDNDQSRKRLSQLAEALAACKESSHG